MGKKMLLKIHDQCGKVQHTIALNYDVPSNYILTDELLKLHKLLEKFIFI